MVTRVLRAMLAMGAVGSLAVLALWFFYIRWLPIAGYWPGP